MFSSFCVTLVHSVHCDLVYILTVAGRTSDRKVVGIILVGLKVCLYKKETGKMVEQFFVSRCILTRLKS